MPGKRKASSLAKLSRPRLYNTLPRERLFRLLDEQRRHPAIWVSGPPGAGKTVLVTSYLESRDLPALWYHVDAGDSDLSTYFYYLSVAAKRLAPRARSLPLLTSEYLLDVDGFSRRYFRQLFARMPDDALLVLDNVHEVARQDAFARVLGIAIAELPEHLNLVCVSRIDPPPVLSQHIASEALVTLGWEELKFTLPEAQAIAVSRKLEPNAVQLLLERAGGWAAGLTLMLERFSRTSNSGRQEALTSSEGGTSEVGSSEASSKNAVFDYFATQVFGTANDVTRETLVTTSIFSTFTAQQAREISGNENAHDLLEELCRRRLFTYRRSSDEKDYQYHDLFREFLLNRLQAALTPDALRALHDRTGSMLNRQGFGERAFMMFVRAENWGTAIELLLSLAPQLLQQGRWQVLDKWLRELPDQNFKANPWLLYWAGIARVQTDLAGARALLNDASDLFGGDGDQLGRLLSACAIIDTYYFEYNDFTPMDPWITQAANILANRPQIGDRAQEARVYASVLLAITMRQPSHPLRETCADKVAELIRSDIDVNAKQSAATALVTYCSLFGDFARGMATVELINPIANRAYVSALNRSFWWLYSGYMVEKIAQRKACRSAYDRSDSIAAEHGLKQTAFLSKTFRVYHYACWGDLRSASHVIKDIERTVDHSRVMDAAAYHLSVCCYGLAKRDGKLASIHAEKGWNLVEPLGSPVLRVIWLGLGAHALILAGNLETGSNWLRDVLQIVEKHRMVCYRPWLNFVAAYQALRQSHLQRCHELMREALREAHDNDSFWFFRWMMNDHLTLFAEALRSGIEADFVLDLIRTFDAKSPREDIEYWPWPIRIYTLGRFQLVRDGAVLRFAHKAPKKPISMLKAIIAFGGSNVPERKIADTLWPDLDGDAAHEVFTVNLHRLRKLLGRADAVALDDSAVSLDRGVCWCDALSFGSYMASDEALDPGTAFNETSARGSAADTALTLYRGTFLPEDEDAPWALSARERLRAKFVDYIGRLAGRIEAKGRYYEAGACYQRGIETDDLVEQFYQGLIRCHTAVGNKAEALNVYRRLHNILSVERGTAPSPESEKLYASIRGD